MSQTDHHDWLDFIKKHAATDAEMDVYRKQFPNPFARYEAIQQAWGMQHWSPGKQKVFWALTAYTWLTAPSNFDPKYRYLFTLESTTHDIITEWPDLYRTIRESPDFASLRGEFCDYFCATV